MYDPFAPPPMQPPVAQPPQPPGVMMPGGGTTGAPLQPSPNNALGAFGHFGHFGQFGMPQIGGYLQALQGWRGQRPDRQGFTPDGGAPDFRSAIMDWRQQRPTFGSYMQAPTGVMPTNPNAGI